MKDISKKESPTAKDYILGLTATPMKATTSREKNADLENTSLRMVIATKESGVKEKDTERGFKRIQMDSKRLYSLRMDRSLVLLVHSDDS